VAERCGITPDASAPSPPRLARVAFEEEIVARPPWTDFRGEKHDKMIGRPVSFHAMRGISAHSNGFQTCRALHVLQILLGTVEVPGGFRFKPPYPQAARGASQAACKVTPGKPLDGPHLGFVHGPEDLIDDDGTPRGIDKAFTWENPMSAHGLMHMVISNAHAGDPYKIDTLFMYMANMAWNSSMNTSASWRC
jgi:anaerobic selenocysteine-containing dehydrogenase